MSVCRVVFLVVALVAAQAWASEFTVDDWRVSASIRADGVGSDGGFFDGVENPFSESHAYELSASSASALYDFAWDETGGEFLIETSQQAEGLGSGNSVSASAYGRIYITPSEDLSVHVDGTFDYNMPADEMMAEFTVSIWSPDYSGPAFWDDNAAYTLPGMPLSGTLTAEGDYTLYAGYTWELYYTMRLRTFSAPVGQYGTSTGNLTFTITPEPSTAGLLAMCGVMFLRRRRRRA